MRDVSRRDAVKLAAGLAVGGGAFASNEALGQEAKKMAGPQPADPELELARENPEVFMFAEQVTFKTSVTDPHTFDLVLTSARGPQ